MKIGIFDSGVGGITVLKEALKQLPQMDYIFYADNLHVPYGTKTKEQVLSYVNEVVEILIKEGVEAIVIACNTATSIAVNMLREKYKTIPIIGMEPAVKLAIDQTKQGRVLTTATPLTLKEEKFKNLLSKVDDNERVDALALPELVEYAEKFIFDEQILKAYFEDKFAPYDLSQYSALVLGCTHFVYYKELLTKILPPHITVYDGNEGTIRHLKEVIGQHKQVRNMNVQHVDFYYSGEKNKYNDVLVRYLSRI